MSTPEPVPVTARPTLRVDLLGPLRLVVDGRPVEVPGPKRRALLALLGLAGGRTVSVSHLLDALWPGEPPESGPAALHSHVSRLRAHLGPAAAALERAGGGYRLRLPPGALDAGHARELLRRARDRPPAEAVELLDAAVELWRGPALADLLEIVPLAASAVALEQLHREILDLRVERRIEAGQLDGVVELAADGLAADPLREPAALLLMRALAAAGRAPQALRTARDYRRRLAEETGLDPSPALAELERAIAGGAVGGAGTPPVPPAAPGRPAAALFGRTGTVAELRRLLAEERLVTLVGPGGVGKTRVALEVARLDGAEAVLRLAPVTDPALLPQSLAAALDLRVVHGGVLAACTALLATRPVLLVVDNCEHVLDAARDVVQTLLDGCPELTVLATSRRRFGLAAERVLRLAPLPVPAADRADDGGLSRVPSVAMFLERAGRVRTAVAPDPAALDVVAEIVRRLDGMPLAIELAAGRMAGFALTELRDRLHRALDLIGSPDPPPADPGTGDRPPAELRHRTLRATVEWSYQLLPAAEQRLFRHLSVFVDGVDLDTAEHIAGELGLAGDPAGALAHLVDASMIDASFEGRTRYRMLETLRAFGHDRLVAAGELAEATDRLLRWALELAAWIDETGAGEREPDADTALRREVRNLAAAWQLARAPGRLDDAVALLIRLREIYSWRDLIEIRGWADELVDDPELTGHPRAPAVLGSAALFAYHRGDPQEAARLARLGLTRAAEPISRWYCLEGLALAASSEGAFADCRRHALAAEAEAPRPTVCHGLAVIAAVYDGDLDGARALLDSGVPPASTTLRGFAAYAAGELANAAGDPERAAKHYTRALELARESGATFLDGIATVGLQTVRVRAGRTDDALRGYRDVIDYFARNGNWPHLWTTLRNLAVLLRGLGDPHPAALLDDAADQAPDAPTVAGRARPVPRPGPVPSRAEALATARKAIARHLRH